MSDVDRSALLSFLAKRDRQHCAPQSDGILEQLKCALSEDLVKAQKAGEDRAGLIVMKEKGISNLTATNEAETQGSWAADLEDAADEFEVWGGGGGRGVTTSPQTQTLPLLFSF